MTDIDSKSNGLIPVEPPTTCAEAVSYLKTLTPEQAKQIIKDYEAARTTICIAGYFDGLEATIREQQAEIDRLRACLAFHQIELCDGDFEPAKELEATDGQHK